jgi:hypothetical protein
MDAIVTSALVGTAQLGQIKMSTDIPIDSLIAKLPENSSERLLLLNAGAWAIYRCAGKLAENIPAEVPEPAPEESDPACTRSVSMLLHRLFLGDHGDLLPEALELLRKAGYRLPHELLPMALSMSGPDVRSALFPVLGERGYWLSRFNSDWNWVQQFVSIPGNSLPPNTETLWEEGTASQRAEILRRLRVFDTVKARTWLEATWKQENAETRSAFLQTLVVGLSSEDEAFLEHALDDRAANVRSQARHLLVRIPSSDFANRVQTLADSILTFTQGKLKLTLPTSYNTSWQRYGISEKPQGRTGERAWWLIQILVQVPLSHWEEHASMAPVELIAAADIDTFGNSIVEGWTRSAILFTTSSWSGPLWDWWHTQQKKGKLGGTTTLDMRGGLIRLLSSEEAEPKVLHILRDERVSEDGDWEEMLDALSAPWSDTFGAAYLELLWRHLKALEESLVKNNFHPSADSWCRSLARAAIGLPVSCFREALESYSLPELATSWQVEHWRQQLHRFTETLSTRQRLYEEMKKE